MGSQSQPCEGVLVARSLQFEHRVEDFEALLEVVSVDDAGDVEVDDRLGAVSLLECMPADQQAAEPIVEVWVERNGIIGVSHRMTSAAGTATNANVPIETIDDVRT
jgi:hypothetical protein